MAVARARFIILQGPGANQPPLLVHFNPQSLQMSYQVQGPDGSQLVAQSGFNQGERSQKTGTITTVSMDLLFDTTEKVPETDVRNSTASIVALLQPPIKQGKTAPADPLVRFSWGSFIFDGNIVSIGETVDFFSERGVPLRSTVKLSMSKVEKIRGNPGILAALNVSIGIGLSASAGVSVGAGAGAGFSASASLSAGINVGTTSLTLAQAGDSLQALAGRAGVDSSWKAIAAANNIDNPRAIAPGTPINLNTGASVGLGGATASASASLGTGS